MDEQLSMLLSCTDGSLTQDQAARLLKLCNNDANVALNKFFDQGVKALEENEQSTGWDNTLLGTDRYGQQDTTSSNIPSFNIDFAPGHDHYPYSGPASVAPSRPPSRTSHHSATSATLMGDSPMQSIEHGQESGLVGNTAAPLFGPANRDSYEEKSWAMIPISTSAEVVPDAEAVQRKRPDGKGEPAILKPLANADYLPALITILETIPIYRNAFLAPEIQLSNYKVGPDWWKGTASGYARTVDTTASRETEQDIELLAEMQRLMTFFEKSNRAYGSVGNLQKLDIWKESREPIEDDDLLKFLVNWGSAYQNQTSKPLNGVLRSMVKVAGQNQESYMLDVAVTPTESGAEKSLYDVLDDSLFTPTGYAHIVDVSSVIILRLANSRKDATTLGCTIPIVLYVDRYLEENKDLLEGMLKEKEQCQARLNELEAQVKKRKYHTTKKVRPGEQVETLKLLKTSMKAFQSPHEGMVEDPSNTAVLEHLKALYDKIEGQLNALEEQKKQTRETLDSIAARFKAPLEPDDETAMESSTDGSATTQSSSRDRRHQYNIVGASTRPGVYYLRQQGTGDFWRIEYSTATSEAYIFREVVHVEALLHRISSEHHTALVVYANYDAAKPERIPIPQPLIQFIKEDNRRFDEELAVEANKGWDYGVNNNTDDATNIEPIGGWNNEPYDQSWTAVDTIPEEPPQYAEWNEYGTAGANTGATAEGITTFYDDAQPPQPQEVTPMDEDQDLADRSSTTVTLTPGSDTGVDEVEMREMREVHSRTYQDSPGVPAAPTTATSSTNPFRRDGSRSSTTSTAVATDEDVDMLDATPVGESQVDARGTGPARQTSERGKAKKKEE